jgi:hypothetical protein
LHEKRSHARSGFSGFIQETIFDSQKAQALAALKTLAEEWSAVPREGGLDDPGIATDAASTFGTIGLPATNAKGVRGCNRDALFQSGRE